MHFHWTLLISMPCDVSKPKDKFYLMRIALGFTAGDAILSKNHKNLCTQPYDMHLIFGIIHHNHIYIIYTSEGMKSNLVGLPEVGRGQYKVFAVVGGNVYNQSLFNVYVCVRTLLVL